MKKYLLLAIVIIAQSNIQSSNCKINKIVASDGQAITASVAVDYFKNNSPLMQQHCGDTIFTIPKDQNISLDTLQTLHKLSNKKLPVEKVTTNTNQINNAFIASDYLQLDYLTKKLAEYISQNKTQLNSFLNEHAHFFDLLLNNLNFEKEKNIQGNFIHRYIAIDPKGECIVSIDKNKNLVIIDPITGNIIKQIQGDFSRQHIAIDPNGKYIVSVDINKNKNLVIIDTTTGNMIKQIQGNFNEQKIAIDPNGKFIVSLDKNKNNNLVIIDPITGDIKHQIQGDFSGQHIAIDPNGKYIVSVAGRSYNYNLVIIDPITGKIIKRIDANSNGKPIAIDSNGKFIVSIMNFVLAIIDNPVSGNIRYQGIQGNFDDQKIAIDPNGKYIVSVDKNKNNNLVIIDTTTGNIIKQIQGYFSRQHIAIDPNGKYIVSVDINKNKNLVIIDPTTGNIIKQIQGDFYEQNIAIDPNGKYIVSVDENKNRNLVIIELQFYIFMQNLQEILPNLNAKSKSELKSEFVANQSNYEALFGKDDYDKLMQQLA